MSHFICLTVVLLLFASTSGVALLESLCAQDLHLESPTSDPRHQWVPPSSTLPRESRPVGSAPNMAHGKSGWDFVIPGVIKTYLLLDTYRAFHWMFHMVISPWSCLRCYTDMLIHSGNKYLFALIISNNENKNWKTKPKIASDYLLFIFWWISYSLIAVNEINIECGI